MTETNALTRRDEQRTRNPLLPSSSKPITVAVGMPFTMISGEMVSPASAPASNPASKRGEFDGQGRGPGWISMARLQHLAKVAELMGETTNTVEPPDHLQPGQDNTPDYETNSRLVLSPESEDDSDTTSPNAEGGQGSMTDEEATNAAGRGLNQQQRDLLALYGEASRAATLAALNGKADDAKRLKKMALLHSRQFDLAILLEATQRIPFTRQVINKLRSADELVRESEVEIYRQRQTPIHPLITKANAQNAANHRLKKLVA